LLGTVWDPTPTRDKVKVVLIKLEQSSPRASFWVELKKFKIVSEHIPTSIIGGKEISFRVLKNRGEWFAWSIISLNPILNKNNLAFVKIDNSLFPFFQGLITSSNFQIQKTLQERN
jgi:hypothetical protein